MHQKSKFQIWLKKENRPLLGHFDFFLPLDLDAFFAFAAMHVSNFCVIKYAYFKIFVIILTTNQN
ncbi:MAG: hypothetical protein EB150_07995 [Nitrososphaeria archaeon]|nr:hypothetical protein [Nitrososphaeria archaeon]